jgi:hypothetical protein
VRQRPSDLPAGLQRRSGLRDRRSQLHNDNLGEQTVKKTTKKLTLNRETLRHLEENTLVAPVGGAVTQVDCTLRNGSCISTRPTCFCTSAVVTCNTTPN